MSEVVFVTELKMGITSLWWSLGESSGCCRYWICCEVLWILQPAARKVSLVYLLTLLTANEPVTFRPPDGVILTQAIICHRPPYRRWLAQLEKHLITIFLVVVVVTLLRHINILIIKKTGFALIHLFKIWL